MHFPGIFSNQLKKGLLSDFLWCTSVTLLGGGHDSSAPSAISPKLNFVNPTLVFVCKDVEQDFFEFGGRASRATI